MTDRNLIDSAIEVGATFDWITPLLSLLSRRKVIAVPREEQVHTATTLRSAGIRIQHEQIIDGKYVFDVAPSDLEGAAQLLGLTPKEKPMIGKLIYLLPDVINPLDGLWGRSRHGQMHRFSWIGVTGATVERILRRYGIPCYGREIKPDDERACLVPMSQAKWAEYLLCSAGVPLTCRLLDARHAGLAGKAMPEVWKDKHGKEVGIRHPSIVGRIAKWMGV